MYVKVSALTIALGLMSVNLATAQTLTSRFSRVNYGYVYGGGGDSHTDGVTVDDLNLLPADTEHIDYNGNTSGALPNGTPYTAGTECSVTHAYTIAGPLNAFESITASASDFVLASATGAGVAAMDSSNPGNQLKFEFNVQTPVHYQISGHFNHPNPGVFSGIQLEWFNGFTWQAVFSTFFTPNGPFNQAGILQAGTYRMDAFIGLNAQANQSFTTTYDYVLTMHRAADMNCDGLVNGRDVSGFVTALLNAPAYAAQYPLCDRINADVDFDNVVTSADIAPFVQCVLAGGCQS